MSSVKFQDVDSGDDVKDVGKGPVFITIVDDDDPVIVAGNQVWITWMQVGGRTGCTTRHHWAGGRVGAPPWTHTL